ncbi:hypothetical protein M427DRAFT_64989 [Gonapodya prolifera JEL478]|uniref:Ribosome maturation protein SDO1/SBDS N-terminal domain-containing protein n=1 Tax=Gonapodya prolifera (strain JEL478) TaxID=1344416 RepID=A0A138ZWU2_GONPJ|nr:hypothetical protein M427DRAFT_64989 [Gonapodya prolifera JEL478]|eukprot:KXS08958.1 hypothetical protein M427DRAFT_64989 [Gonapodya prolifera JEL478]
MSNTPAIEQVIFKRVQSEGGKDGVDPMWVVYANEGMTDKWRHDKSIPLVDVVQTFDVWIHRTGSTTGVAERPSKGELDGTFSTHRVDSEVIPYILEQGTVQPNGGRRLGKDQGPKDLRGAKQQSRGQGASTMPSGSQMASIHG